MLQHTFYVDDYFHIAMVGVDDALHTSMLEIDVHVLCYEDNVVDSFSVYTQFTPVAPEPTEGVWTDTPDAIFEDTTDGIFQDD